MVSEVRICRLMSDAGPECRDEIFWEYAAGIVQEDCLLRMDHRSIYTFPMMIAVEETVSGVLGLYAG